MLRECVLLLYIDHIVRAPIEDVVEYDQHDTLCVRLCVCVCVCVCVCGCVCVCMCVSFSLSV
jgi:hypothetical protein